MRLKPTYRELDALLDRLGLKPVPFPLDIAARPWRTIDREISIEELDPPSRDGVLRYKGEPVFLYIRDVPLRHDSVAEAVEDPEAYTRFHVADCQTLDNMRRQKRFERYVVTNRARGPLRVFLRDGAAGTIHEAELDLRVCRHCLQALDWEGYTSGRARKSKTEIWHGFSREAFLEQYSPTFSSRPRRRDTDGHDDYPPDWPQIRDAALKQAAYRCASCGVRVPEAQKRLLDVHHVNGVKSDNHPTNLRVLCKLCHARQPQHGHYRVKPQDRAAIEALRRGRGIRVGQ